MIDTPHQQRVKLIVQYLRNSVTPTLRDLHAAVKPEEFASLLATLTDALVEAAAAEDGIPDARRNLYSTSARLFISDALDRAKLTTQ